MKLLDRRILGMTALLMTFAFQNCGGVHFSSEPTQNNGTNDTNGVPSGNNPGDNGGSVGPNCTISANDIPIITTLPTGVTAATIQNICPGSVGQDTACGVVVFVTSSGLELYFTGQGPYDGNDDTLVGVYNLTATPVNSLSLASDRNIMGFDGDGLDMYHHDNVQGNSMDQTGYGGPNAYYTNITMDNKAGEVDFITPVAANGSTFFGLENALTSKTTCLTGTSH